MLCTDKTSLLTYSNLILLIGEIKVAEFKEFSVLPVVCAIIMCRFRAAIAGMMYVKLSGKISISRNFMIY